MFRFLLLSLFTFLLVACGQIGPLYLPEEEATPAPPAAETAADTGQVQSVDTEAAPVEVK